ncbi:MULTISPECIES: hypothetical protein [Chryseobacterium]|uniref:hypothetical protein n=1 Tax=Chryseobacterium TaxID=59732 RepID=UPI001BE721E9|nr:MULTISPECIES: hypothetical protein [Chryseobacterium]MBT2619444.1 hypothetical protein [Chryseobacterium sp. ISL-6]
MKYNEAVQHKKEALKKADETVLKDYHIIITPANTDESQKHIKAFMDSPKTFSDESCKKFCSDDEYEVVSFRKDGVEDKNR